MNKRQNSQMNMLELIETHFDNNAAIWSSNPLIAEAKAALSEKIDQIRDMRVLQRHNSVGATMDKALLRKDLEAKALSISTAICAYTWVTPGQKELYRTVYMPKSDLKRAREADLLLYAQTLEDAALAEINNLGPYGVFETTITALAGARTAFYEMLRTPQEISDSRKDATVAGADLLRQGIALLNHSMDKLVDVLWTSAPDFVKIYFSERKIHKPGTRTLSLEILTLNAADGTPLADAQIEVVDHHIKRKSSKNGTNKVQNLKAGYYTLSVSHLDFVSQLIPFSIVNHETTKLVVELEEEVAKSQRFKGSENGRLKESELQRPKDSEELRN